MKGKVKFFNDGKGFGFIVADDGKDYFVHQTGLNEGVIVQENDSVTFDVEDGDRGPKAVNVSIDTESSDEAPVEDEAPAEDEEEPSQPEE